MSRHAAIRTMPHTVALWAVVAALIVLASSGSAMALPSFAEQTGQPCAACHVGAFGPQLKPYGREFKLYGYTATDGKPHGLPIAATAQASFTHTDANQPGPASRWFASNNNPAFDQASVYYAGKIAPHTGGFIELNYDGVGKKLALNNADLRYANDATLLDTDFVYGFGFNNSPSVQDVWNSSPAWGFPYNRSALAPTPMAAAQIDGSLAQQVAGASTYVLWDDLIYAEAALYQGLAGDVRNALGQVPVAGANKVIGLMPYWRLALQHQFGNHYLQVGLYGLTAAINPGGLSPGGATDRFTDTALDANWQWIFDSTKVTSDMVSAHATYIREDATLGASSAALAANPRDRLDTFRADISYSRAATWTPSVQYFRTAGSLDPAYWGTPSGRPNSAGFVAELAYVPFGKPDSPFNWFNIRLAAQYIAYTRFDGATTRASANNALYLSAWTAIHF